MKADEKRIREMLNGLRQEAAVDFSALAAINHRERYTCWRWVSGNLNERYSNIRVRHGQGIEGEVIKVGRGLSWNKNESQVASEHAKYSILLTEKLESAFAVPVMAGQSMSGILLIGDRSHRIYEAAVREKVVQAGMKIAGLLVDLI
ncbi:GAF domain-containing protein [Cohnella cholangitidis]|uniref:GAF domain-containing protein n=1 Tax=Cohnella cholangitidis TaxID=2598458 RepID=A0A7G5C1K2_9BACL|nr:GAF domain-containing protein [Cohnella cholangitidis]QMV43086.1 hypothetical protein FPL14_19265 [Cohnella cholangitidis]